MTYSFKLLLAVACALFAAWALKPMYTARYFTNDAAQHISTANNIAAGNGISTDILYYDIQHEAKALPAAQTIWPPGYPILVAGVSTLGFHTKDAVSFVNLASVFVTGALIFFALAQLGVPPIWSLVPALAWLAARPAWAQVVGGASAAPATALAMASTLLFLTAWAQGDDDRPHYPFLAASGALAGLSFSVAYAFAFFVLSLGIASLALIRIRKASVFLLSNLAVVVPASIVVMAVFARNLSLAGTLTSRPPVTEEFPIAFILRHLAYSISHLTGIDPGLDAVSLFVGAGWILIFAAIVWMVFRQKSNGIRLDDLSLPVAFVCINSLALFLLALQRGYWYVEPRYLAHAFPWLLIAFVALAYRMWEKSQARFLPHVLLCCLLIAWVGQVRLIDDLINNSSWYEKSGTIQSYLDTDMGQGSLSQLLDRGVTRSRPLFANEPQLVGMILDKPVIGIGKIPWSRYEWDEAQTFRLLDKFNVEYVLVLPALIDNSQGRHDNQPLLLRLKDGFSPPDWLDPIYTDRDIRLYRFTGGQDRIRSHN